jgi:hypothetical protein
MFANGWYMKRSVQKDTILSDSIQTEFLNFLLSFFLEIIKFKNLATFQKCPNHIFSNALSYFLYTLLPGVILFR